VDLVEEVEEGLVAAVVGLVTDAEVGEALIEEDVVEAADSLVGVGVVGLEAVTTRLGLQTRVVLLSLKAPKLNLSFDQSVFACFYFPN